MTRIKMIVIAVLFTAVNTMASDYKFAVGFKGLTSTLFGGAADSARFAFQAGYGIDLGYSVNENWSVNLDLSSFTLYEDTAAGSSFSLGANKEDAGLAWEAYRLGAMLNRRLFSPSRSLDISFGLGGGLIIWKYVDPQSDTVLKVPGTRGETIDYSATEVFVGVTGSVELGLFRNLAMKWTVNTDHLTTAGAEFQKGVNAVRPRWLLGSSISLNFLLGHEGLEHSRNSESSRVYSHLGVTGEIQPVNIENGKQESGKKDIYPTGPSAESPGFPGDLIDTDKDGVVDERDDCPDTDPRARRSVDIFGCPVDSDFDGIADYLDACPNNPVGAHIDSLGRPFDSDLDGVPDGLDDCPRTLYGLSVDAHGCLDISILSRPMVLNIDYRPGSYEVDQVNQEKIMQLARILNLVPTFKMDVIGYTDNIGNPQANQILSKKRAARVRDILVALDVAPERIKVFGRGESNFVASNQTAEGRAQNRRIEIIFYR